jgi:hypothetical protein
MSKFIGSNVIDFNLACPDESIERAIRLNAVAHNQEISSSMIDGDGVNVDKEHSQECDILYSRRKQQRKIERDEVRAQLAADIKAFNQL